MNTTRFLKKKAFLCIVLVLCVMMNLTPLSVSAETDNTKLIAFTFDDGPSTNTPALLDGLKSRGAVVTFFMCGVNGGHGIRNHGELLDRMIQEGHQLANHSYDHPSIARLSGPQVSNAFARVENLLFEHMGGSYIDMVRPPGGVYNPTIKSSIQAPIILWSLDTLDWKSRNADSVYDRIMSQAEDGKIVLMHDLYETSVQGALRAVDSLKEQGYEFVTVSELLRRRGIVPENGQSYTIAPNQGNTLPAYTAPVIEISNDDDQDNDTNGTRVTMSTADQGLVLYYTTDGSYPTMASHQYTEPVKIRKNTTFTVVGYDAYGTRTPSAVRKVKKNQVADPRAVSEDGAISLSCNTNGAELHYTTNGSEPTSHSARYTDPFICTGNTLKVIGVRDKFHDSEVVSYAVTKNGTLFQDVDVSEWYFSFLDEVVSREMMNGTGEQRFDPDGKLTRSMMAQILYNLDKKTVKKDENDSAVFSDVSESDWYFDAVNWAVSEGIVKGYGANRFGAQDDILREQLVTMLYRYEYQQRGVKDKGDVDLSDYSDGELVEDYAREAFIWALGNGIVTGYNDGTLNPQSSASRAETAAILTRYAEQCRHSDIFSDLNYFRRIYIHRNVVGFFDKVKGFLN